MENIKTFTQNLDLRKIIIVGIALVTFALMMFDLEHPMHHHSMNPEVTHETVQHVH